jgi:hypothetical protein
VRERHASASVQRRQRCCCVGSLCSRSPHRLVQARPWCNQAPPHGTRCVQRRFLSSPPSSQPLCACGALWYQHILEINSHHPTSCKETLSRTTHTHTHTHTTMHTFPLTPIATLLLTQAMRWTMTSTTTRRHPTSPTAPTRHCRRHRPTTSTLVLLTCCCASRTSLRVVTLTKRSVWTFHRRSQDLSQMRRLTEICANTTRDGARSGRERFIRIHNTHTRARTHTHTHTHCVSPHSNISHPFNCMVWHTSAAKRRAVCVKIRGCQNSLSEHFCSEREPNQGSCKGWVSASGCKLV